MTISAGTLAPVGGTQVQEYEAIVGSSHEPQFGVYTFYRSLAVI